MFSVAFDLEGVCSSFSLWVCNTISTASLLLHSLLLSSPQAIYFLISMQECPIITEAYLTQTQYFTYNSSEDLRSCCAPNNSTFCPSSLVHIFSELRHAGAGVLLRGQHKSGASDSGIPNIEICFFVFDASGFRMAQSPGR